ncbi:alanine racemase [Piscinibacter koreensis]|uniref:Alanine racemase n=1 Tax=Piscinibacter koreensis TaxID=2742824 RepID=A0A7Y6NJH6_9BURK|nr:alanine racemase [Schlegelella koreensis]NUZ04297.1 alanine racemase [Schlegelella koreensis]
MTRPIEALIHTDALQNNLARARAAASGARVWAVVKANAYGHGIAAVYDALKAADGFALLDVAEAEQVRALGWRGPILLLEGCFDARDLDACSRLDVWHVVHRREQIEWLAAHKTHVPHHVFLKLNSGMNRLGFAPAAYRAAWLRLDALPQVDRIGLVTHLADADAAVDAGSDGASEDPHALPPSVARQVERFEAATAELPGERSLANSAATLRFAASHPAVRGDWVRPGIMLYGSSPDHPAHGSAAWGLEPAMSLRSQLIACQDVAAGEAVGYGSTFRSERPMRIGVVACGYADGYPRVAPGGNGAATPVLVDGVRTRLVGRVSMDMLAVDLGPVPGAHVGSEVTLWGRATSGAVLPIDEVAAAAGTLGYELMCARAPRVPTRVVP